MTEFLYLCKINHMNMRTAIITDNNEIESIIKQCKICYVGIMEKDGTPYVIPMCFGYAGNEIILHSGPEGKHLDLLKLNNNVCVTFCTEGELKCQHPDVACSYSLRAQSVLCKATVEFIEDIVEKEQMLGILMKTYIDRSFKFSEPALQQVKVWKLSIDQRTAKSFGLNFK